MGLFGFIKKQFIDIIEMMDTDPDILMLQFPMQDREIQNGGSLTVREGQMALFINEGKVADLFKPGRYKLNTATLPVLTYLNNWDKLFESPFKSDVFFFSTREQLDQKWGTTTPLTFRDKEFGPIRLRTYGSFAYKVSDPKVFFQKITGAREVYKNGECDGQLKSMILTQIASTLGAAQIPFLEMAANQNQFSQKLKVDLTKSFQDYGLELTQFLVQSLSLPEELQTYLDKATSMKMVGDLRNYTQFQAADSFKDAAQNQSGGAGAGMGLGAGIAMGQSMAQTMAQAFNPQGSGTAGVGKNTQEVLDTIEKLHQMQTKGIISSQEFESKKAELLKNIT